jgi:hypothetical protein
MFISALAVALDGAQTLARVDEVARDFWKAFAGGSILDAEAERFSTRIEERRRIIRPVDRTAIRAPTVPRIVVTSCFPAKRRVVSPDRAASQARRRRLAASGPMPPALAAHFTVGQLAVLRIVGDEVRANGSCALTLAEIGARAGVCLTTARDAVRAAASDGLLVIEERRRNRAPNLANVVRIVSREWRVWLMKTRERASKALGATDSKAFKPFETRAVDNRRIQKGYPEGKRRDPASHASP